MKQRRSDDRDAPDAGAEPESSSADRDPIATRTTVVGGGPPDTPEAAAGDEYRPEYLRRGALVERFVILRALGSGGAGVVYAAHDPDLDRTVALKLLHLDVARHQHAQARFLREAQALAKLSHPNVISIYDIGAFDDRAFIAMEFVDGLTFREWMAQRQRPWREVVAMLAKAARGLAAAHAAGLTHRDFKPDNVLVGNDGRVLVTDFGLARAATDDEELGAPEDLRQSASGSVLSNTLTGSGLVLGTPGYMAPEQWLGESTGPHTDQFSFCVTLYEALFGKRPFAKTSIDGAWSESATRLRQLPRGHGLPPWLVRAVLRGIEPDPADRHPSMDALLARLTLGPRRARRIRAAVAAAALAAVGAFGLYAAAGDEGELCGGAAQKLDGVWDQSAKLHLRAAFLATKLPYAADTWERVQSVLDDYSGEWIAVHTGACEATHVHRTQSEALLDRQMACIDGRRRELAELVALLREPTGETIEHAVRAARSLSPLEPCSDLELLADGVEPPRNAAIRAQVEALRAALARAKILADAGRYADGLELAQTTAATAAAVDYLPVRAEAHQQLGDIQLDMGSWSEARASLAAATWNAEASGHDWIAALALVDSVFAHTELAAYDDAAEAAARAEAAVLRAGNAPRLRARLANSRGALAVRQAEYERAFEHFEEALALTERSEGQQSPRVGSTLHNLGLVAGMLGQDDEELRYYRRALAIEEASLGSEHPSVATTIHSIGRALSSRGEHDEALEHYHRALAVLEPLGGGSALANLLTDVGIALRRQGRYDEAEAALRRVLDLYESSVGAGHPRYGQTLHNLANVAFERGQVAEALTLYRRSLEVLEGALGPEHPSLGRALATMCAVHLSRDEADAALPHCRRALTLHERSLPADHPLVLASLLDLGKAHLGRREGGEAAPLFARALSLRERGGAGPAERAEVRFGLARALWQSQSDRGQALELARRARDEYAAAGAAYASERGAIESWLRARP